MIAKKSKVPNARSKKAAFKKTLKTLRAQQSQIRRVRPSLPSDPAAPFDVRGAASDAIELIKVIKTPAHLKRVRPFLEACMERLSEYQPAAQRGIEETEMDFSKVVSEVPQLARGRVWCRSCGSSRRVDSAGVMSNG
jgi:hypothetical protein